MQIWWRRVLVPIAFVVSIAIAFWVNSDSRRDVRQAAIVFPKYHWKPGLHLVYTVNFERGVDDQRSSGGTNVLKVLDIPAFEDIIRAPLIFYVLSDDGSHIRFSAQFGMSDAATSRTDTVDLGELASPVIFDAFQNGKLDKLYVPEGMSVSAGRFWQAVLPFCFVTLPEHPASRWTVKYSDPNGDFSVLHSLSTNGAIAVTDKKYYTLKGSSELGMFASIKPALNVLAYDQEFKIGATSGVMIDTAIRERLQFIFLKEAEVITKIDGSLHLKSIDIVDPSVIRKSICEDYNKTNWEKLITSSKQYRFDDLILAPSASKVVDKDYSFDEFLKTYKGLGPRDTKARSELFSKLRDAIVSSPAVFQAVCRKIEDCENDRPLRQRLLDSLASVGTPDCQKALAEYIRDPKSDIQLDAILSSGVVIKPESVLIDAVMDCVRNRNVSDRESVESSLSVLGAFGGRLDGSDPQKTAILFLISAGASDYQKDVGLLRAYFSAWSNTQLPEAKDRIVERIYPGASYSVWDGAIFALENLRRDDARQVLMSWSQDTTMPERVRIRAIRGLANSELEPNPKCTQIISDALATLRLDRGTGQAAQRYIARAAKAGDEVAIALLKQMKGQ